MLKNVIRKIAQLSLLAAGVMSCSGHVEDETVPEGVLRIFVDGETTIPADGRTEVVFRVMYGSTDVSSSPEMNIIRNFDGDESRLPAGVNVFSTTTPGTYTFTARYYDDGAVYTDNEVTVTASPAGEIQTSQWYQKVLAFQFTSTTCIGCPDLTSALKSIESEKPGVLCPVAFHLDYQGSDPMTIQQSRQFAAEFIGSSIALPALYFNMHQPVVSMSNVKAVIDEELDRELDTYDPSCGVAVSSELAETGGSVSVSVKVKSNLQQRCRVAVFLVEDGIVATQIDDPDYVHDNVVRTVLSEGIYGDYLNGRIALYPGTEYEETYSADLPEAWNAGNMRVVAAVLVPTEDGSSYYADNVNSCPLAAGSSDYQIVK